MVYGSPVSAPGMVLVTHASNVIIAIYESHNDHTHRVAALFRVCIFGVASLWALVMVCMIWQKRTPMGPSGAPMVGSPVANYNSCDDVELQRLGQQSTPKEMYVADVHLTYLAMQCSAVLCPLGLRDRPQQNSSLYGSEIAVQITFSILSGILMARELLKLTTIAPDPRPTQLLQPETGESDHETQDAYRTNMNNTEEYRLAIFGVFTVAATSLFYLFVFVPSSGKISCLWALACTTTALESYGYFGGVPQKLKGKVIELPEWLPRDATTILRALILHPVTRSLALAWCLAHDPNAGVKHLADLIRFTLFSALIALWFHDEAL